METTVLLLIMAGAVALYVTQWLPIGVTSLLIPPALYLTGILGAEEALSGFSNPATVTIAALFVVSAGLARTGTLDIVTNLLRRGAKGSPTRVLVFLALTVPITSALMNNIPVVAMFVPVVLALSRELEINPSKLMIPLSFFAILGGTCTLIGTGTNVLVHDIYRGWQGTQGIEPTGFRMFEFAPMGLILVIGGVLFLLTVGRRILPERTSLMAMITRERTAQFVTEIVLHHGSRLPGMRVGEVFPARGEVRLLELIRGEQVIMYGTASELVFEVGDSLIVSATSRRITEFLTSTRSALAPLLEDDQLVSMHTAELVLAEAVVLPGSPFVGRRVGDLRFNHNYGVKVLALQRGGRHHRKNLRDVRLKEGDVFLLQGSDRGFEALRETEAVLLAEGLEGLIRRRERAPIAVAIMVSVVGLAAFTSLPIEMLAVAGAGLMIAARCLRAHEAFASLDASVLLLLAGTIPLGVAMETTGLAEDIVSRLMNFVGGSGPWVLLSAFYLFTSLVTNFLSNKATAVLLAPLALQLATQMGVDPRPFMLAICFAASASFATPIGYPTNLIVLGPGGYNFTDFVKIGVLMNALMWILATLFLPLLYPF